MAVTLVGNDYGSEVIGHAIEPFFQEAVLREGFRPLPPQEKPIVMNVKGRVGFRQEYDAAAAARTGGTT